MHTLSHFPSESNTPHTTRHPCVGFPDDISDEMDAAERERARLEAEAALMQVDTTHCAACGCESAGNVLAGIPVQLCDRCLTEHVITTVGIALARDVVAELADTEAQVIDELAARRGASVRPAPPLCPIGQITSPFVRSLRGLHDELTAARAEVQRKLAALA